MSKSHVLIVAVDGFRATALGAYGNTTYLTPALDQFASQSVLFDACIAPSADLSAVYRALWHSLYPLRPATQLTTTSLPRIFFDNGYATTLITDDTTLASLPGSADFQDRIDLSKLDDDSNPKLGGQVDDPPESSTARARWFAATSDCIEQIAGTEGDRPQLLWAHARGMYGAWDAPLELQRTLLDESDPPPVEQCGSPELLVTKRDDPDTAFRYGCAYAAQVMDFDAHWQELMETMAATNSNWLTILIGARGFPLGEHDRIGGVDDCLHVEQLHVPLLMRSPNGQGRLTRRNLLVTHADLLPTLDEWLKSNDQRHVAMGPDIDVRLAHLDRHLLPHRDGRSLLPMIGRSSPPWRGALLSSASNGSTALRTPNWTLRQGPQPALFVRPDDRWEANDVASLCPEVAGELAAAAAEASRQIATGEPMPDFTSLDELSSAAR